MKLIKIILSIFICTVALHAQDVELEWVKHFGGEKSGLGNSIATDDSGNVYIGGFYNADFNFDLGTTHSILSTTDNNQNSFIAKLNAKGELLWVRNIGGINGVLLYSIALDVSGDIYATGAFHNQIHIHLEHDSVVLSGGGSFIIKINSVGDFIWAKQIGPSVFANGIALNKNKEVYVEGWYIGNPSFDPSIPGLQDSALTSFTPHIFIVKLDSLGDFMWVSSFKGTHVHNTPLRNSGIAVDKNGYIYTTGSFSGTYDFDPGPNSFLLSAKNNDAYIVKLNSSGNLIWANHIGEGGSTYSHAISVDLYGNPYITGSFSGNVNFTPGSGNNYLNAGTRNIFICKFNSNGDFQWAKRMGGNQNFQAGRSIALDRFGNSYLTGTFGNTGDFGHFNLSSGGHLDAFIVRISPDGTFDLVKSFSGPKNISGNSITVDYCGNIYTTGHFDGTVDFDPGQATHPVTSIGEHDVFVNKLSLITKIDFGPDTILCLGDSMILKVNINLCESALWSNGDTTSSITVVEDGLYYVSVISLFDSILTDTIEVKFKPRPTVYIGPDTAFCGLVDYIITSQTEYAEKYFWNTGDTTKTLHINNEGIYSLKVSNTISCYASDTILVEKIDYPFGFENNYLEVCGSSAVLDAGNEGNKFVWDTGETTKTITVYLDGIYTVTINNGFCSITDALQVVFLPEDDCRTTLFAPNSFSPNIDENNDVFKAIGSNIGAFKMEIFNRWGELIFWSNDLTHGWDGTFKGTQSPEGVYIYKIEATGLFDNETRFLQGTISLIR